MGTVLKIAAGVLIGLLAYQIIIYRNIDYQTNEYKQLIADQQAEYEAQRKKIRDTQTLRNNFVLLTNSIATYYRKNKALPMFISDLQCADTFRNREKMDCAKVYEDGVFYVNHENEWVSAEPYVLDGKLYNKCKASISLSTGNDKYQDCAHLDISTIPEEKSPPFDCDAAAGEAEKIICASDKLIANEVKLSLTYETLLEQSSADKKPQIIDDQVDFINLRRKTCYTSDCIEEMTLKKILRLEFLGVWKKDG
jgi:hypothetical protein